MMRVMPRASFGTLPVISSQIRWMNWWGMTNTSRSASCTASPRFATATCQGEGEAVTSGLKHPCASHARADRASAAATCSGTVGSVRGPCHLPTLQPRPAAPSPPPAAVPLSLKWGCNHPAQWLSVAPQAPIHSSPSPSPGGCALGAASPAPCPLPSRWLQPKAGSARSSKVRGETGQGVDLRLGPLLPGSRCWPGLPSRALHPDLGCVSPPSTPLTAALSPCPFRGGRGFLLLLISGHFPEPFWSPQLYLSLSTVPH